MIRPDERPTTHKAERILVIMASARTLVRLTDVQWARVLEAPIGVVVLCRSGCGRCDVYQADIERYMRSGKFAGITLGKVVVDDDRGAEFLRSNAWAANLPELPTTVIYLHGAEAGRFVVDRAAILLETIAEIVSKVPSAEDGACNGEERC
jgi:hypothetical protein